MRHNLVTNGRNFIKLVLNIFDHGLVMHVSFVRMSLVIEELLSFDCLYDNELFCP